MTEGPQAPSTITINVQGNETSFKGYEIFKATVTDQTLIRLLLKNRSLISLGPTTTLRLPSRASSGHRTLSYAGTTAQDAADWITAHVNEHDKYDAVQLLLQRSYR
jgi:hypothetical protein